MLNGKKILESENMFTPERVDVTEVLSKDGDNELVITFDSAYFRGWELVEKYPNHKWGVWNGDNSRLAVRKSQYHWVCLHRFVLDMHLANYRFEGWDWGPTLLTCGPWRPINLEIYESRITDLWTDVDVDESLKFATVTVHAPTEGPASKVRYDISLNDEFVASKVVKAGSSATFNISDPELWYPTRYGKQPLYTIKATLEDDEKEVDTKSKKTGFRRAQLVQRPLKEQTGTSFFFEVNNIPIFCGGSDWIPADNFVPRISKERYRDWVKLVADGNQFMIRVWGGGIYEEQAFYDACDEFGILVWQDFMFGCGNYPAWPEMLASIQREAEENVRLLRHHPSIVIYAGNNEDYQFAESENLTWDKDNHDPDSWLQTDFPARYIYEKILPDVCAALSPRIPYHPGSPWGGKDTRDPTVGDIHQWNVWHGTQEKYQNFDKLVGRFVSEFGMEAFPDIKTIDAFLPRGRDDPDRYAQSSTVDFHNKADGHERRIALYLVENFRYAPDPLEAFVYATQLMQAECLASAYRLWKRQWKGPGREYCAGALVWQTNDCWPVTSWSIADYYLRPKHAYYTVRREMADLTLGMTRREHTVPDPEHPDHGRAGVRTETKIEVWASNLLPRDDVAGVDCVLRAWDVETGERTHESVLARGLALPRNRSTEVAALDVPVRRPDAGEEARTVLAAYLVDAASGRQLARYVNWPEPLKYLHLQRPKALRVELQLTDEEAHGRRARSGDGGADAERGRRRGVVRVSAEVPVKGLALECDDDAVVFEDNLVDLVPGETVEIGVRGARPDTVVGSRYLGMD